MKLIDKSITSEELKQMSERMFGGLVKAVVDVRQEIMVVDAALQSDQEAQMLQNGSKQEDLWGINLYPELEGDDFIEFDSMINIRPSQKNLSRAVSDIDIQEKIRTIVKKLVT